MVAILSFLVAGALLVLMALARSYLQHLPLSNALLYLLVGVAVGPAGLGLLRLDPFADAALLERLSEVAVIISLFTAGLKLRAPLGDPIWAAPLRLAFGSMTLTVAMIAAAGSLLLGLPLGAAVLLGAVLAPTDPVLASDVQVERPSDRDRLRFGLTGEAGLNDGTAFPFVMLGLGLLGLHEIGALGWRWLAVDVLWAIGAGLAIGWLLGQLVGRLVLLLRSRHREAIGTDDFLTLGLIALAYGAALLAHSYGFLAVFAAGLALRQIERSASGGQPPEAPQVEPQAGGEQEASDPQRAPAHMARAVLGFNEQLERIAEVAMVVLLGSLLVPLWPTVPPAALWFVPLLLLAIRPLAVAVGLLGSQMAPGQRALTAWFGIRGVGSIYYLMYALTHGAAGPAAATLVALTLVTVAASIVVHGVSVTPLMRRYRRAAGGAEARAAD